MSPEPTRIHWQASDVRSSAANEGTHFARSILSGLSPWTQRELFNAHQREMADAMVEHYAPGVMIFAAHERAGLVGRLWLSASDSLRVATIGRHTEADLCLTDDDELSLRHLLVLVTSVEGRLNLRLQDLDTGVGFRAEAGERLGRFDSNGLAVITAGSYSLFCFPTGCPRLWDPSAPNPFSTLPERTLIDATVQSRRRSRRRPHGATDGTFVAGVEGLIVSNDTPLLLPGEQPLFTLCVSNESTVTSMQVGPAALARGILLGRYGRCGAVLQSGLVSRVHAVVTSMNGAPVLVDTCSTNGTWSPGGEEIPWAVMREGGRYRLGEDARVWWTAPQEVPVGPGRRRG